MSGTMSYPYCKSYHLKSDLQNAYNKKDLIKFTLLNSTFNIDIACIFFENSSQRTYIYHGSIFQCVYLKHFLTLNNNIL